MKTEHISFLYDYHQHSSTLESHLVAKEGPKQELSLPKHQADPGHVDRLHTNKSLIYVIL